MDRLTAMHVFAEVATSGSFSATADKLEMSRAMVTRYVGEMEQWLQARLLQRTTRSVTLTDAGEHALRRCQQMLALSQDLEEETATTTEGALRGQLRLTCSVSFAFAQMGAAIADFLAQHPQLKIDLDASEGSLNLVEKRIDLAIRISAEPDPLLIGRPLASEEEIGERLSKRHGAVSVTQYRDDGYLPEALVNYLARLGWSPLNAGPAPPSRSSVYCRLTHAACGKLPLRGASEAADREFVVWSSTRLTLGQALSLLKHLVVIHSC